MLPSGFLSVLVAKINFQPGSTVNDTTTGSEVYQAGTGIIIGSSATSVVISSVGTLILITTTGDINIWGGVTTNSVLAVEAENSGVFINKSSSGSSTVAAGGAMTFYDITGITQAAGTTLSAGSSVEYATLPT